MTASSSTTASRDIPVYPAASTYAFDGELVKLASNETPFPPHPQVLEAVEAQLRTLNRYPDPTKAAAAPRVSRTAPAWRPSASPSATAPARSCSPAAEAMLEPGAEIVYAWPSFSMYPHLAAMTGAPRDHGAAGRRRQHDLDAMAREVTAATRMVIVCNPNNPTRHRAAAGGDRRLRRRRCRATSR